MMDKKLTMNRKKTIIDFLLIIFDKYLVWILLALMVIIVSSITKRFFSVINLNTIILNSSSLGILVLAALFPLITGRVDFSVESTMGFCAMIGGILVNNLHLNSYFSILCMLSVGAAIGLINGLFIVKLGVNFFMQSFAMLVILRGFMTYTLGGQRLIQSLPDNYRIFGNTKIFGIHSIIIIFFLLFIIIYIILEKRTFGRRIIAIGINNKAAILSGVNVDRIVIIAYVVAGFLAAFAGLIQTSRFVKIDSSIGKGMVFLVLAALVIGGVSLFGGRCNVLGILGGVFFIGIVTVIFAWFNVSTFALDAFKSGLIFFAVILDAGKNKLKNIVR